MSVRQVFIEHVRFLGMVATATMPIMTTTVAIVRAYVRFPPISKELNLLAFNDDEFVMVELQMNVSNKKETSVHLAEKFRDFDGIAKNPKYSNAKKGKKQNACSFPMRTETLLI